MFNSKTLQLLQAENAALRGQVSDLHSEIRKLHREWSEERKSLLDRIIALAQPIALRELKHSTGSGIDIPPLASAANEGNPVKRNWPSGVPNMRPSLTPAQKESQMAVSIEEATTLERGRT